MMILFVIVDIDFTCPKVGSTLQIVKMRCVFAIDFRC
jgi:hypothetical protein